MVQPWADKPFPLIQSPKSRLAGAQESPTSAHATEMASVHNMLLRILNSIVLQAPNIKDPKDISDFLSYIETWCRLIHEHHTLEEDLLFPMIGTLVGQPGIMETNVAQHALFAPGLAAFHEYINGARAKKLPYDGKLIVKMVMGFGDVLTRHLTEEIATFEGLEKFGIDWAPVDKIIQEDGVKKADKDWVVPLVLTNVDNTFEGGIHKGCFPPLPWFATLLFRWVYVPKNKGSWRFSSCDASGRPKELPFA